MCIYIIHYTKEKPELNAEWNNCRWNEAETALLESVRPESRGFIPAARAKLLYCEDGICGIFLVEDKYVVCKREGAMEDVWRDSCVEFFVKPSGSKGYFNFEFNCIGIIHAGYITDPLKTEKGFKEYKLFTPAECRMIEVCASIKEPIKEETAAPLTWTLQFFIPFDVFNKFSAGAGNWLAAEWRGNFNKCADESSNPHWITWAPVNELNFHAPESFGILKFEKKRE